MPFKSKAQQRFMFAAEADGDIPKGTAKHWADATEKQKGGIEALPEKVKPMKKSAAEMAEEIVKKTCTPKEKAECCGTDTEKKEDKSEDKGNPFVKKEAAGCATPGSKIRSKGEGQGLARGEGEGPMGKPKKKSPKDIAAKVMSSQKK